MLSVLCMMILYCSDGFTTTTQTRVPFSVYHIINIPTIMSDIINPVPSPFMTRTTPSPCVNMTSIVPELQAMEMMAVRLHPRRLTYDEATSMPVDASKVGGVFAWPMDCELPRCKQHDDHMTPVLQLRKDDCLDLKYMFPEPYDLLQMFWCPCDHGDTYCPVHSVKWWKLEELMSQKLMPAEECMKYMQRKHDESSDYVPIPCVLHPEMVLEYPHAYVLSDDYPELWNKIKQSSEMRTAPQGHDDWCIRGPESLYQYHCSVAPGFKLGK